MALMDRQGRLLGRISIIDVGALLIVFLALGTIFFLPDRQAGSVVQVGGGPSQRIEVELMVRGISSRTLDPFKEGEKVNLIIRNQPYSQVEILKIENVTRTLPVVFPDGSVKQLPDPEPFRWDLVITLAGEGKSTEDGILLGNNKVKIGTPLELETFTYTLRGSIMSVRTPS